MLIKARVCCCILGTPVMNDCWVG